MNAWTVITPVACAVLLLFLCMKEWKRVNQARRNWRLLASVIAVASIACMALPITAPVRHNNQRTLLVLTANADRALVEKMKAGKPNASILSKEELLSQAAGPADSIYVFGNGFTSSELESIGNRSFRFYPTDSINGVVSVDWQRQVEKGKALRVSGRYSNRTTSTVTLLLAGFNTTLDSIKIPASQTQPFHLRCIPRQNGRALFHLIAVAGKDTLEKNPVPVEVQEPQRLQALMLSGSPGFENRFLKDWLSQQGSVVTTQTLISTNKKDRSVFNTDRAAPERISKAQLDSVDVVIGDQLALASLPAAERDAIYQQVSGRGMGLIINGDTIASNTWYTRPFNLYGLQGKQPSRLLLTVDGDESGRAVLPVESPQFIKERKGVKSLVKDSAFNCVTAVAAEGAGKIVFNTLQGTYSWLLSGDETSYYSFWNLVLQEVTKRKNDNDAFTVSPAFVYSGAPVQFATETSADTVPLGRLDGGALAFASSPLSSREWIAEAWAVAAGWQPAVSVNGRTYDWYAFGQGDWSQVAAVETIRGTIAYAEARAQGGAGNTLGDDQRREPVSLFWFFLPFIISSSFLWAERKIS